MTNSGSADETESEMRTRKTRQTACSRKRIWKARARQKSPRIVFEADLWKMLKNSTPWVWLEWIEFFSFFQHFSAFWKLMNAHFSKNSCYSRYSIINEWPHCVFRGNTCNTCCNTRCNRRKHYGQYGRVSQRYRFESRRGQWALFSLIPSALSFVFLCHAGDCRRRALIEAQATTLTLWRTAKQTI